MAKATSVLSLYIDYEYLTAQQLGELLLGLHGLFDELLYAEAPYLRQLPSAPAARLRVEAINTGNSVTIYFTQGIAQLVGSADPNLVHSVGGLAVLMALGKIIRLASRFEDLRAKWRRDNRTDEYHKLELTEKRLEIMGREPAPRTTIEPEHSRQLLLEGTMAVLAEQFPHLTPEQQNSLAERLLPHLDALGRTMSDPNIRRIEITLPHLDG